MVTIPNSQQLISAGTNVGAIGLGLVVGKILQTTIMKNAEGKGLIPDTLLTNGAAAAVLAVGSVMVPNKFVQLMMAATAGYFLIRSTNKATEKLNGLGSLSGSVKDFLTKYVPQLNGVDGNEDFNEIENYSGYGNVIEEAAYLAPVDMNMAGFNPVAALPQAVASPSGSSFADKLA